MQVSTNECCLVMTVTCMAIAVQKCVKVMHVPNVSQGLCSIPGRSAFYSKTLLTHAWRHESKHDIRSSKRRHAS